MWHHKFRNCRMYGSKLLIHLILSAPSISTFFLIFYFSWVQAGNIYLLDYAIMDGIPTNTIRGKLQYIAAPLCLLYQHPDKGLVPIAIQVYISPIMSIDLYWNTEWTQHVTDVQALNHTCADYIQWNLINILKKSICCSSSYNRKQQILTIKSLGTNVERITECHF